MRPRRREAVGLALLPVLAACSSSSPQRARSRSHEGAGQSTKRVATALGPIAVTGDATGTWTPLLVGAAARVRRVWGRASRPVRIVVCPSDESFESVTSGLGDMTAAVTTASAIYLSPSIARSLTTAGREVVLAHELTHAVLGHFGSDHTAMWVKEGAAEWTAEQGVTMAKSALWPTLAGIAPPQRPNGPPDASEFAQNASLAYETAAAYATYLVENSGSQTFQRFVRSRPGETEAQRDVKGWLEGKSTFTVWLTDRL